MGRFVGGMAAGVGLAAIALAIGLWLFGGPLAMMLGLSQPSIPKAPKVAPDASAQALHDRLKKELPFDNTTDFEFAGRGFVASLDDPVIKGENGQVVYDLRSYDFLKGEAPLTANPSLWRQARLITRHGLFKLSGRIYQVRGFDVSIVSFILTDKGVIVVDPLVTVEAAKAALGLFRKHVGERPVVAVIYSHSHADHYGGVKGIVSAEDVAAGRVAVIAPDGFLEHAVSENVIAGNAMARRARYQFGLTLPRGPEGEMTSGLGPGISRGTISLIPPTDLIKKTGEERTIDGVTLAFQLTPGTEAPAEMNFYLPQFRALFMAENANATMHNVLTPRGALVRDAKVWADYLTQSIRLYADKSEIMFAAHGVPRFGQAEIESFLKKHRDAYKFLHDQSVRLMNAGLTSTEIAERIALPDVLAREWYNRGYYGTMSFNSKAVYQRYMGWYDANPASLTTLPPEDAAKQYVGAMGGADAVLARAKEAMSAGDHRWAIALLNHLAFADKENKAAREMLAEIYTQSAYRAEAGTWRNIYLSGAQELRSGVASLPAAGLSLDMIRATPTHMLLDFAAVRLNPERVAGQKAVINIVLTDFNEKHLVTIENGVLVHESGESDPKADATVTMKRADLLQTLFFAVPVSVKTATGEIKVEGKAEAYTLLTGAMDPLDQNFPIVTP